jgi:hypothetical protein
MKLQLPALLFANQKIYKTNFAANSPVSDKKVKLLLVYSDNSANLSSSQTDMLIRIVAACGFKAEEKMLINIAKEDLSLARIALTFPETLLVIVFGDIALSKNILLPKKNFPVQIGSQFLIYTSPIAKLETDKTEKTRLWNALQRVLALLKK